MKRANIYKINSNDFIEYLLVTDELNKKFQIYKKNETLPISYGYLSNNTITILDIKTNQPIEYLRINNNTLVFLDKETGEAIKNGSFL